MQRIVSRFDILSDALACQLSHTRFHIVKWPSDMTSSLFDLSGKVALVTGSTRGIGKSRAEERARAVAKVAISSRKAEECEQTRAAFEKQGFEALAKAANISRKDDLQGLVDAALAKWGRLDIVIANAASNPYFGPLTDLPDEAFDKIFANNVKSVLWLAAMTLPGVAERAGKEGTAGSFLGVGSARGRPRP